MSHVNPRVRSWLKNASNQTFRKKNASGFTSKTAYGWLVGGQKQLILALVGLFLTGLVGESGQSALVTVVDDGASTTTVTFFPEHFDGTGLASLGTLNTTQRADFDGSIGTVDDITLTSGNSTITVFSIAPTISAGWTNPNNPGSYNSFLFGPTVGEFYADTSFMSGGITGAAGFTAPPSLTTFTLPGLLSDYGFTAGESLTFNNPNVAGPTGQLTIQTYAVPEPQTYIALLCFVCLVAGISRRRRRVNNPQTC